jgi:uncharacterized SAM-binding protein YcdF (DUF218 family)
MLVDSEAPQKADIVLVLAGDSLGNRVLKGAELVREGYAPKVFLSNGRDFYGLPESEAAANFAVSHGYSRETLIAFHGHPTSTEGESRAVTPVFRSMGIHKVLLVTSPSHTARATRIFRKAAPDLEFHPVAAPDPAWCRGYWWTERECEKTWFFEEVKTITGPFGI